MFIFEKTYFYHRFELFDLLTNINKVSFSLARYPFKMYILRKIYLRTRGVEMKACNLSTCTWDIYFLTEWEGQMRKYLAWGHGVWTKHSSRSWRIDQAQEVCVPWVKAKFFLVWPNRSQTISIFNYQKLPFFGLVWLENCKMVFSFLVNLLNEWWIVLKFCLHKMKRWRVRVGWLFLDWLMPAQVNSLHQLGHTVSMIINLYWLCHF